METSFEKGDLIEYRIEPGAEDSDWSLGTVVDHFYDTSDWHRQYYIQKSGYNEHAIEPRLSCDVRLHHPINIKSVTSELELM